MDTAGTLNQRWRTLGVDPLDDKFKEAEVFAGYRFEAKIGKTLRRPGPNDPGVPDFIDQNNQHWAAKGPIPSQGNFDGLLGSIRSHMDNLPNTNEKLIVGVAGLDSVQVSKVKSLLSMYDPANYELLE